MALENKSTLGLSTGNNEESGKNIYSWIKTKQELDGAEGLWRIHDNLYDLTDFITVHPGGRDWLEFTKGTDITEAFESHHNSSSVEHMLEKFEIRKAAEKRRYPFTFKDDCFYKTLKKNVRDALKSVPKHPINTSNVYIDTCLCLTFIFSVFTARYLSCICALISSYFLTSTVIAAHNYIHKRDNIRMYYFDLSFMSSREWRISHILSHHLYPNTVTDLEMTLFEPVFQFLPKQKTFPVQYGSWIYFFPIMSIIYIQSAIMRYRNYLQKTIEFQNTEFVPFILPFIMYTFGKQTMLVTLSIWIAIIFCSSIIFGLVGMTAHHHPSIFHDGDTPRSSGNMDWGIFQLDTVMDNNEISGNHYLSLTTFGNHGLHHLFPTLDHGILPYLYPTLEMTMKQFGVRLRVRTKLQMFRGLFLQLARITPNTNQP